MSCSTHHSGCECYDKEFSQTKAENRLLRAQLAEARAVIEFYGSIADREGASGVERGMKARAFLAKYPKGEE